jgi:hypothetical protein
MVSSECQRCWQIGTVMSNQNTVAIVYRLNAEGRKASLLTGGDGKELQVIRVPVTPELLALAEVREDGSAWIYATGFAAREEEPAIGREIDRHANYSYHWLPSIIEFYAAKEGEVRREEASHYTDLRAKESLSAPPADVVAWVLGIPAANEERKASASASASASAFRASFAAGKAEEEAKAAQYREAKAAAEAAAEAAAAETRAWVAEHGSSRLKKCSESGMLDSCMGIYRDERLALERPGWQWDSNRLDDSEIHNPSEAALDALLEARKVDPEAELLKQRPKGDEYEDEDDRPDWVETVRISLPWAKTSAILQVD